MIFLQKVANVDLSDVNLKWTVSEELKVENTLNDEVSFNNNPFVAAVGTKSDMRCIIVCRNRVDAIVQFCSLLLRLRLRRV